MRVELIHNEPPLRMAKHHHGAFDVLQEIVFRSCFTNRW